MDTTGNEADVPFYKFTRHTEDSNMPRTRISLSNRGTLHQN